MKVIKGDFDSNFRNTIVAWLDGNKVKLTEIQKREDMAQARRSKFKLINCKYRV